MDRAETRAKITKRTQPRSRLLVIAAIWRKDRHGEAVEELGMSWTTYRGVNSPIESSIERDWFYALPSPRIRETGEMTHVRGRDDHGDSVTFDRDSHLDTQNHIEGGRFVSGGGSTRLPHLGRILIEPR